MSFAVDQHGQVIDVLVSERRDGVAARAFSTRVLTSSPSPVEITTDRRPFYPRELDEFAPAAWHVLVQYANNHVEADHGPPQGAAATDARTETIRSVRTVVAGHAFVQNLRRNHYELTVDLRARDRVRVAFAELARCI